MKFRIFLIIVAVMCLAACKTNPRNSKSNLADVADPAHTSRNALDWDGVYRGILPCADCQGIQTEIRLKQDLTYQMNVRYMGRDDKVFSSDGTFTWNEAGSIITLSNMDEATASNQYQVGEEILFKLDMDGKRISGELASNYTLSKEQPVIYDKYWKLIELNGRMVSKQDQNREAHLIFRETDNRITGNSGCNALNGSFEILPDNMIKIYNVGATKMACPDMEPEQLFFRALEMADNFSIKGDTLSLNRARMTPLARFVEVFFR